MIRDHVRHLHDSIDGQPITIRGGIALASIVALPVFGTAVRTLGSALSLGRLVLPLLVLAHVPAVVALLAIWSIGCDVCRSD